jgi:hypothetical protein
LIGKEKTLEMMKEKKELFFRERKKKRLGEVGK